VNDAVAANDAELRAACARRREPMLRLLEELVEESSYTDEPAGGRAVGRILARELERIGGLEVREVASSRFAPHLVATSSAARASSRGAIALVGHLDTVFPPGTFVGFVREGERGRGPGVVDMKGGLALVVHALGAAAELGVLARLPVRLVVVSDEEVGSPEGATVIASELAGAACALVFESGRERDAIVLRRKGTGGVTAVARGRAAHAGNHHADGANAIWALGRFIDGAQALTDYATGVTVSTGTVRGGRNRNTVPDEAEALLDLRFVRAADGEALVERLRRCARDACVGVAGTSIEVRGGIARPPLEPTDASRALYAEYARAAAAAGFETCEAPLVGGGSDAATTAALGIPSIDGLGPRGGAFHTHDEWVDLASFAPRLEALVRFVAARAR
jgi:glutamate carboxypeptidase